MSNEFSSSGKKPDPVSKLAYSIDESCKVSTVGRTKTYEAIGSGALIARKVGRRTVILHKDLESWLDNLPEADFASCEVSPDRAARCSPPSAKT